MERIAPARTTRPAPSWRLHLLRHAVELALEHPDELEPVLEHHLRDTARAVRSALYGSTELVPPPELPVELEELPPLERSSSTVTPLANSRVRKAAHGFRAAGLRELFLAAIRAGATWERTGSGHVRIVGPRGVAMLSSTAADGSRAVANARAELRRAGLDLG